MQVLWNNIFTTNALLRYSNGKGVLMKYECQVCGYIYDEETGDEENGIKAGTKFSELPSDWVCPLCGAGKDEFKEVK